MTTQTNSNKLLESSDLVADNVDYGSLNTYNFTVNGATKINRYVPMFYRGDNSKRLRKFMICVRNCVLKKVHVPKTSGDGYGLFLSCHDDSFIKFVENVETHLPTVANENNESWFDADYSLDDCKDLLQSMLITNEYGTSLSLQCSKKDFKLKFITDTPEGFDESLPLEEKLLKNYNVDVLLEIRQLNIRPSKYVISAMAHQANVVSLESKKNDTPSITPDTFDLELMDLTPLETYVNPVTNMPAKTCKIGYNNKPFFKLKLTNVSARMMKIGKDNDFSYSIALTMTDELNEMFTGINNKAFDILKKKSKDYYGRTKTAALLKKLYNDYPSYGKEDKKLIENGESPKYPASLWLKVYYRGDKDGLGDKFKNKTTGEVITDPDQICNKDLTFSELIIFNKHIWFGEKTSTNFTVSEAELNYEVESYDMDSSPLVSLDSQSKSTQNTTSTKPVQSTVNEVDEASDSSEEDEDEDDDNN